MTAKSTSRSVEVTIDLVAETAGVSRATVSRVINGSAKVSPETEKAVRKAIKKYNFVILDVKHRVVHSLGIVILNQWNFVNTNF